MLSAPRGSGPALSARRPHSSLFFFRVCWTAAAVHLCYCCCVFGERCCGCCTSSASSSSWSSPAVVVTNMLILSYHSIHNLMVESMHNLRKTARSRKYHNRKVREKTTIERDVLKSLQRVGRKAAQDAIAPCVA